MPWKRFQFRDQEVFVRVLEDGKPIVRRELVEMRYRLGANKSYKTSRENIVELEGELISDTEMGGVSKQPTTTGSHLREEPQTPATESTIIIYTDGACSGNPGPAGIGIYLLRPTNETEISEFIASGTNNSAELSAILRALENLTDDEKQTSIHLYTDSAWSLGVLIGGWKAKTNLTLIKKIQALTKEFPKLELLKIRGHSGHPGNEHADHLATRAIRREDSSIRKSVRKPGRGSLIE